jgi:hypothetical protein
VLVYADGRGWCYYWREGDVYAYMLRTPLGAGSAAECAALDEHGLAPQGSIGCRWTPDLFDEARWRLVAIYERGRLRGV